MLNLFILLKNYSRLKISNISLKIQHCDFSFKQTIKRGSFWFLTMKPVVVRELKWELNIGLNFTLDLGLNLCQGLSLFHYSVSVSEKDCH